MSAASDAPGIRRRTAQWPSGRPAVARMRRRLAVAYDDPEAVLPAVGTKELIAGLPWLLELGPGDRACHPSLAYPTCAVGAILAGADPVPFERPEELPAGDDVRLVWVNSPANPHGAVLGLEHMRAVVTWARQRGVMVASDECYIGLGWEAEPVSVLHPAVCDGDLSGLLAVHSGSSTSLPRSRRATARAGRNRASRRPRRRAPRRRRTTASDGATEPGRPAL
jgi:aspartate/methionine/tyrosine aminotransferase